MQMYNSFLPISLLLLTFVHVHFADENSVINNNIAFDLPDLVKVIDDEFREIQLEAFKSTRNDVIMRNKNKQQYSQLFWVSLGNPTFIRTHSSTDENSDRLFHFSETGFFTYVQMLTPAHRSIFVKTIQEKYNIAVKSSQILNLILSKFECIFEIYNKGQKFIIKGNVKDFKNFPLRINFAAPTGSKERELFRDIFRDEKDDDANLEFNCNLASSGKQIRTNKLTITSKIMQNLQLTDKIFGPVSKQNEHVYVTREQMNSLTSEIYSALNIVEEYEMPEFEFKSAFLDELIKQATSSNFEQVPFLQALETLTKYSVDFSKDLKPDEITKDMGSIFQVEMRGNVSRIVVNEENLKKLKNKSGWSIDASGSVGIKGVVDVERSVNLAREKSNEWLNQNNSKHDQLKELNTLSDNQINWQIDGLTIIPKSISVSKMSRTQFSKTIIFNKIRRQVFESPFQRFLSIYTSEALMSSDVAQSLNKKMSQLKPLVTVIDTDSNQLINSFASVDNSLRFVDTNLISITSKLATYNNFTALIAEQKTTNLNNLIIKACRICIRTSLDRKEYDLGQYCSDWTNSARQNKGGSANIRDTITSSLNIVNIRLDCRTTV